MWICATALFCQVPESICIRRQVQRFTRGYPMIWRHETPLCKPRSHAYTKRAVAELLMRVAFLRLLKATKMLPATQDTYIWLIWPLFTLPISES